jgi:hypothetical protein
MYARDYLDFAEKELGQYQQTTPDKQTNDAHLINCVSYLKRAMDCQLDTFMYAFNLYRSGQKGGLSLPRKLEFLKDVGVFSSRSLMRLNAARNKMEHEYEIPKIQDIEAYFDIVTAFVAILESILDLGYKTEITRFVQDESAEDDSLDSVGFIRIKYLHDGPEIKAEWGTKDERESLQVSSDDQEDFAFLFRVWVILCHLDGFASRRYVASRLQR